MKIHELLTELFSPSFKPAPENNWRMSEKTHDLIQYRFDIDKKRYVVTFTPMAGIGPSIQRVEFGLLDRHGSQEWGLTGTGDSTLVMELVYYTIIQATSAPEVKGMFCTAKEPTRQKLYAKMSQRLATATGWIIRSDLAEWLDNNRAENPYLVIEKEFADRLEKIKEKEGDAAKHPPLVRQPDTFGQLPVRFD